MDIGIIQTRIAKNDWTIQIQSFLFYKTDNLADGFFDPTSLSSNPDFSVLIDSYNWLDPGQFTNRGSCSGNPAAFFEIFERWN